MVWENTAEMYERAQCNVDQLFSLGDKNPYLPPPKRAASLVFFVCFYEQVLGIGLFEGIRGRDYCFTDGVTCSAVLLPHSNTDGWWWHRCLLMFVVFPPLVNATQVKH